MTIQVQLCSEELDRELNLQLVVELLYCTCKYILCSFHKVRGIASHTKTEMNRFIKNLNCHLNRLSVMRVNPLLRKPIRPYPKVTIVCRDHNGPENLGAVMFELDPKELSTLHPKLMLEFLELFVEESARCIQRKWVSVPALFNLPTVCVTQVKKLSKELYWQLKLIKYNQDKEYYPIVSVILTIGGSPER